MNYLNILTLLFLLSCGQNQAPKKIKLNQEGEVVVIVLDAKNTTELKNQAYQLGIKADGEFILTLKGEAGKIESLDFEIGENFDYLLDSSLNGETPEVFKVDGEGLYQAKKDFGILEFWKSNPSADGRGVIVGVVDDGISPHQDGFKITSTGERKFLQKFSQSSFSTFDLLEIKNGFEAVIDENRSSFDGEVDLNQDGHKNTWKIFINKVTEKACLDINVNGLYEEEECRASFSKSGEYFLTADPRLVLMFEIDLVNKKIQLFQPEKGSDSHGEGVASVFAGHRIGNRVNFDGVAPGAQIVDYDLSEITDKAHEKEYSMGTFLKAFDQLGQAKAEVVNVSYSFGFTSTKSQLFMSKAIDALVKKYNMVISFSAGNNGPGLGSLNRRSIYPNSVLIAGAYVSKELDERVHGVSGLPEEGRVVYYSSRGPGLGVGPLLISPLSSLVNSSPDSGHRAFSGTSSASPALAGAATVLLSAIKQENLKVDAATIVHALKLSARRLKAEPFIFQGFGLPQLTKALSLYRELIKGVRLLDVKVLVDREFSDGVAPSGIFIKTSETMETTSRKVTLTGSLSPLAPSDAKVNLLTPVRLVYPKGIKGSRELWVSQSAANLYLDINPQEILGDNIEAFAEVKVISTIDNSLLTIIPVTIIQDQNVLIKPSVTLKLSSQEGLRFHLNVPSGVSILKIKAEVLNGDDKNVNISFFDINQIRVTQQKINSDLLVSTRRSGYYQVGVSRIGGTPSDLVVRLSVEPVMVNIKTRVTQAISPEIQVLNSGSALNSILRLTRVSSVIESAFFSSKEFEKLPEIQRDLPQGIYAVELSPVENYDLSYFMSTCSVRETSPDGKIKLNSTSLIKVDAQGLQVNVRCMPFDYGAEFEKETQQWVMRLLKTSESLSERLDILGGQLKPIQFTPAAPGIYRVEMVDPFLGTALELTQVELI